VVTGFRVHPGGAQAYFGIKADLATYGKVLGGGISIGVVAGKAKYMDALDGGQWQFGDDSIPEVGVTFFAGTFVRQPLALAAAEAVLNHLEESGPELQEGMNQKVERFVKQINQFFEDQQAPYRLTYFSSFFCLPVPADLPNGDLIFYYLRERGIHVWESRPLFFTTAHTDEDIEKVVQAFKDSILEMQQATFLPLPDHSAKGQKFNNDKPPVPGARLGKNAEGNPAWFIEDKERKGKYIEVKR
jgi:glutamate-1-semialdehyde aminotransferase